LAGNTGFAKVVRNLHFQLKNTINLYQNSTKLCK